MYNTKDKVQTTKYQLQKGDSPNLNNLTVYLKAKKLAIDCFNYTCSLKFDRRGEFLILQLLKAVTSIGANIAEGYGRHYKKSYR